MKFIIKLFPEITIKSQSVRLRFIKILTGNIRNVLKNYDETLAVVRHWDHIEVRAKDENQRPAIRDALTRIPGIHHILEVEDVPFTSLHDFVNRLDAKCYNRKTLEALIKGGAFDSTGYTRKQLMFFVDETPLLESASKRQKDRDAGQVSMFDLFGDDPDSGFEEDIPEPDGVEWPKRQLLSYEKEIMKIYVSDHPLTPYENYISRITKWQLGDLAERTKEIKSAVFVGMISNVATKLTKRGTKMATFTLEDTTGSIECICFKYEENAEAIQEDAIVKIKGKFESGDRGNQIMAFELEALELNEEDARPSHLELRVPSRSFDQNRSAHLSRILNSYPGRDGVVLFVQQADGRRCRAERPVSVDAQSTVLKAEIRDLFGPEAMIA